MSTKPRPLDLICLGRAGVDFYAQQVGSRLEDVQSFNKYLGGSSCNIACMSARLGLKSSMLTRVGDEHMGRFLRETMEHEGVDVSHLKTDPERLTALVVLGLKDKDTFPLIFYRENCADMAVSPDDFDEAYIASAKALLITGTHLSTPSVLETAKAVLNYAKKNGTKRVLDIDYRPVLWGLTAKGEGEKRFVASATVSAHLQSLVSEFDLIVGTEEEFHIAGGSTDTLTAIATLREKTDAVFVVKRGPLGASVFPDGVPNSLDTGITEKGVRVEVLNVLGAGDAFMSGFLSGWIAEKPYAECLKIANACGALVVSRHGCTPAMPTQEELQHYLKNQASIPRPDRDTHLNYLHRVTTRKTQWDNLHILAFDHRKQFIDMAHAAGAPLEKITRLKSLLLQAVEKSAEQIDGQIGVLIDDSFGADALNAATGKGWWIGRPVEQPGSRPLKFEHGDAVGTKLIHWPEEQVIKCLVFTHPDDAAELRHQQERQVLSLYQSCLELGRELLLEVIPPKGSKADEQTIARQIARYYNLGVFPDWWKLPALSPAEYKNIEAVITKRAPHCRGILMLGLDAPMTELTSHFALMAGTQLVKGFAIGRTIWSDAAKDWLSGEIMDRELIRQVSENYLQLSRAWSAAKRKKAS